MRPHVLTSLIGLTLAILTTACSSTPESRLAGLNEKWAGRSLESRVAVVGTPDAVLERLDGTEGKVYRWVQDTTTVTPGWHSLTPVMSTTSTGTTVMTTMPDDVPGQVIPGKCNVDAWVGTDGVIDRMSTQGRC